MREQKCLPLGDEAALAVLWESLPEDCRDEVVKIYAQLIARAVRRGVASSKKEESVDDKPHR